MPTILLTAFEPFGGANVNPSACIVGVIGETIRTDIRVVTAILPVVAAKAPRQLASLIELHEPDAILSLGEARGRDRICVEKRAVNRLAFQTDNSGAAASDGPVLAEGADEYASTFPAHAIVDALTAAGIDAVLSESAGTYCCNQILYHALHHAATGRAGTIVGFLHLPSLPEQRVNGVKAERGMPLDVQVRAVQLALGEVVRMATANWSTGSARGAGVSPSS